MNYCNWTAVQKALEAGPSLFGARNEMRTHVALVVLIVIAKHINRNSEETYLSYETIAAGVLYQQRLRTSSGPVYGQVGPPNLEKREALESETATPTASDPR